MEVTRRRLCRLVLSAPLALAAESRSIRGRLISGTQPYLEVAEGSKLALSGDKSTMLVLGDQRLNGAILDVNGEALPGDSIRVGPIHTNALRVVRDNKALMITYWCDTCAIRTFAPGICVCCQDYTELDLRESK
jgi:hypothetical protein